MWSPEIQGLEYAKAIVLKPPVEKPSPTCSFLPLKFLRNPPPVNDQPVFSSYTGAPKPKKRPPKKSSFSIILYSRITDLLSIGIAFHSTSAKIPKLINLFLSASAIALSKETPA